MLVFIEIPRLPARARRHSKTGGLRLRFKRRLQKPRDYPRAFAATQQPLCWWTWVRLLGIQGTVQEEKGAKPHRGARRPLATAAHGVEELGVVLGLLDLVDQIFGGFELVHRIEQLAQH